MTAAAPKGLSDWTGWFASCGRDRRQWGRPESMNVAIKRIYEEPGHNDGTRVLVDRVWPRGVAKAEANLDEWVKDVAPSTDLRSWYGHDPDKFEEFSEKYRSELNSEQGKEALQQLKEAVTGKRLTLLTATKDLDHSHVTVLAEQLST